MKDNILHSILMAAAFVAILVIAIGNERGDSQELTAAVPAPQVATTEKTVVTADRHTHNELLAASTRR